MTRLTANQLQTVRTMDQTSDLYLAIYKPKTILSAQLANGVITKGAVDIDYDTAVGDYTKIQKGMTLYIGTMPGGNDVGRVRIRSASSTQIHVALDESILYADRQYLTVKDFHELWPVFPRATLNGTILTYYKDYDVLYTDQNDKLTPVPMMGGNYAGFKKTPNNIYFTATGSYSPDALGITNYLWTFPTGSVPATSTSATPGNVIFPDSGFYTVKLDIVNSGAKTGTAYRHVCIYDNELGAGTIPIMDWQLTDLSGEWGAGWTAKIVVGKRADEINDGDLAIIFARETYNGTEQSFGGFQNREHIKFVGYVHKSDTEYNWQLSKTTFYLSSITSLLQNKEMFSVSLEYNAAPNNWTQIKNMTINKILDHYLRWHSTLFEIADFDKIHETGGEYWEHYEDIQRGELFSNVNNMLRARLLAGLSCNRQGQIFTEIDMNVVPTGSRPSTVMVFSDNDWVETPKFDEISDRPLSSVLMGGVEYNPVGGWDTAFLSRAPGTFPAYTGKSQTISGFTLNSQDQVNILAGLYFGKINTRTSNFSDLTAVNFGNIDVAPQELYEFNITAGQIFRGTIWKNKRFIPRKISYKQHNGALQQNIVWEAETYSLAGDGITVDIPPLPPVTPPRSRNLPTRPPIRPPAPGTPTVPQQNGGGQTMFGIAGRAAILGAGEHTYEQEGNKVIRTFNFLANSPTWTDVTGSAGGKPLCFRLDPWNPATRAYLITTDGVYIGTNIKATTPTWTKVLSLASMQAGTSGSMLFTCQGICSPNVSKYFGIIVSDFAGDFWFGRTSNLDGGSGTWTWTHVSTVTGGTAFRRDPRLWISQHTINNVYITYSRGGFARLGYSSNGGAAWVEYDISNGNENSVANIFIPFNSNDKAIFCFNDSGHTTPLGLSVTKDGGTNWIWYYSSVGADFGDCSQSWEGCTESPSSNGSNVYIFTSDSESLPATLGTQKLYKIDPNTSIPTLIASYGSTYEGIAYGYGFGGWPYNNLQMQVSGRRKIYRTTDGGASWSDHTGNAATFLPAVGLDYDFFTYLVPIWTEVVAGS